MDIESLESQTNLLRKRLRTIKRFRRESLNDRALYLEDLLTKILVETTNDVRAAKRAIVAEPASIVPPPAPVAPPFPDAPPALVQPIDPVQPIAPVQPIDPVPTPESLPAEQTELENQLPTPEVEPLANERVSRDEYERLLTLLEHSRREYDELIDFMESDRAAEATLDESGDSVQPNWLKPDGSDRTTTIPRPLTQDIGTLHRQIEFLEEELERAVQSVEERVTEERVLRDQIEVLRTQLLESRHETIELRIQNSELMEQGSRDSSAMSWEQRKEQLLQQLEAETSFGSEGDHERVTALIAASQREIETRDHRIEEQVREIAELQMLLTRQSSVTNGVAVGAAAIAQLLDSDELIQSEREKIRQLKEEYEAKIRNAEIEISLERAKISRERLELEAAALELDLVDAREVAKDESCSPTAQEPLGRPRRWLRRLGLRDE